MTPTLNNIQIILCNTSHPGNIGSAARAMKTMGITKLILVAPICQPDDHSLALASNAADVVLNAKIIDTLAEAIADSQLAIGMTGRKREFTGQLQTPKEITPEILSNAAGGQKISLVFGNEQNGLTIEQLEQCNRMVTIPGNPQYFSLNLAQAVQIICYEIYSSYNPNLEHLTNVTQQISSNDLQHLLTNFTNLIQLSGLNKTPELTIRRLQQILHKAKLERNEADLLHGIVRSAQRAIMRTKDESEE
jgi:tRNA/rRNA methyltransferase